MKKYSVFSFQFSMARALRVKVGAWLLLILVLAGLGLSGCATTESENVSERPWNTPKSWENGLPSSMTEGR
jgi:hypothetical protein